MATTTSTPRLSFSLLGPLTVTLDDEPLAGFEYKKARALLAYLAVEAGQPQTRAHLCALLWPDLPEAAARQNLSQVLSQPRKALGDKRAGVPFLLATTESVQLNPDAAWDVDVNRFAALIAEAEAHVHRDWRLCTPCATKLRAAAALYRGDFLAQFYLSDSEPFEEWALLLRERLRQQMLSVLERLAQYAEWRGAYDQAVEAARRHAEMEPLSDASHRELMRLLALSGQQAAALAQYEYLQRTLATELDAEPEPETTALHEQVRAGAIDPLRRVQPPPSHVPAPPAALIGRTLDVQALCEQLQHGVRLVTLTGAPGIGKTRLALEVAARLRFDFEDGAYFVELAPLLDAGQVASTAAQVLGVKEQAGHTLAQTLRAHLRAKHALLVLDNFEHVLDAAPFVADLLQTCPALSVLITSRTPLRLRAEQQYPLEPLSLPAEDADPDAALQAESVQLFVNRAQAVRADFSVIAENAKTVTAICRRVDGLPLALELIAPRLRSFSVAEVHAQLQSSLVAFSAGLRDLPARHRTLHDAIQWSYDRLDAETQRVFAHLGVFAGGCTAEAAQAVVGEATAVLPALATLHEASLTHRQSVAGESRFFLLETIREFALEQLTAQGDIDAARQRHAQFFAGLAEAAESHLKTPQMGQWIDQLERELDNVRAAVRWCGLHATGHGLVLISRLERFWQVRGHMREAHAWLEELLGQPESADNPAPSLEERARGARVTGILSMRLHDLVKTQRWLEECLQLYTQLNDTRNIGNVLSNLGIVALDQARYPEAERLFREGREMSTAAGDAWQVAATTNNQGVALRLQRRLEEARACFADSAARYQQVGDIASAASAMINMAATVRQLGDYAEACHLCEDSYQVFASLGDTRNMAYARRNQAQAEQAQAETELAKQHYRQAVRLFFDVELPANALMTLIQLGHLELASGDWPPERLVLMLSRMAVFMEISEGSLEPEERALYNQALAQTRSALSDAAFEAAWQRGQTLTIEQAVALDGGGPSDST